MNKDAKDTLDYVKCRIKGGQNLIKYGIALSAGATGLALSAFYDGNDAKGLAVGITALLGLVTISYGLGRANPKEAIQQLEREQERTSNLEARLEALTERVSEMDENMHYNDAIRALEGLISKYKNPDSEISDSFVSEVTEQEVLFESLIVRIGDPRYVDNILHKVSDALEEFKTNTLLASKIYLDKKGQGESLDLNDLLSCFEEDHMGEEDLFGSLYNFLVIMNTEGYTIDEDGFACDSTGKQIKGYNGFNIDLSTTENLMDHNFRKLPTCYKKELARGIIDRLEGYSGTTDTYDGFIQNVKKYIPTEDKI